jgi:hypothetical protein
MKVLLAILCSAMLLFGGGCAVALGGYGGGGLVLIPLAIAVFNAIALAAVFGWSEPWRPAFYILAVADVIIAGATIFAYLAFAANDTSVLPWALAMTAGFGLKGFLTWRYVRAA